MSYYCIYGDVTDSNGAPVENYTVEITGAAGRFPDPVYTATTDATGHYFRSFSSGTAWSMFEQNGYFYDPNPITLTVKDPGGTVVGTRDYNLSWYGFAYCCEAIDINVVIEDPVDPNDPGNCVCIGDCPSYRVRGWLRDPDGVGVGGKTIEVFSVAYRARTRLGWILTDDNGDYSIRYLVDGKCSKTGPGIAIVVEASDPELTGDDAWIASSKVIAEPGFDEQVNLYSDCADGSTTIELHEVAADVERFMDGAILGSMSVSEFRDDQEAYLVEKSGASAERVHHYLGAGWAAARWRELFGGSANLASIEALYAWLASGVGHDLEAIALAPAARLQRVLQHAVEQRIVPEFTSPSIAEIVAAIQWDVGWAHGSDPATLLGSILNLGAFAGASSTEKKTFLQMYAESSSGTAQFWSDYRDHVDNASAGVDVDALQLHLRLAGLTGQNLLLMNRLEARMGSGGIHELRDFASFDQTAWQDLLDGMTSDPTPMNAPPDYPGDHDDERRSNQATALTHRFKSVFPEVAIAYELEADDPGTELAGVPVSDISNYLRTHTDFDIRTHVVREYVAQAGNAASSALEGALAQVQRLCGVTAGNDVGTKCLALSKAGFDSAQAIASSTLEDFAQLCGEAFENRSTLEATYDRAGVVAASVNQVAKEAMSALNPEFAGMIRAAQADEGSAQSPALQSLFGAFDHCGCRHCRSVFSPSAYLVDMLTSLRPVDLAALGCEALEVLDQDDDGPVLVAHLRFHRRPDICHLRLDCSNTNTALPHIDITNELLEERVLWALGRLSWDDFEPNSASDLWQSRQTSWTADELRAHPEHLLSEPYEVLRSTTAHDGTGTGAFAAVRPWILPFDLYLEEARAYTPLLGYTRQRLLELLTPQADLAITRERLGMNSAVYELIVDPTLPDDLSKDIAPTMAWLGDESHSSILHPLTSIGELTEVRKFLRAVELSFLDALELLDTYWVGNLGSAGLEIQVSNPNEDGNIISCNLDEALMIPLGSPDNLNKFLARVHRFRRLMMSTGLGIHDLDEAIQKLSFEDAEPDLDEDTLVRLGQWTEQMQAHPRLSAMEALSWWGDIEARPGKIKFVDGVHSLRRTMYDELFIDSADTPDYRNDGTHVSSAFELTRGPDFEIATRTTLSPGSEIFAHVARAFRISEAELQRLHDGIVLTPFEPGFPGALLSIRNLSLLHLRVSVARELGLEPSELLAFEKLAGIPLSTTVLPADSIVHNTMQWPQLARELGYVRAEGWSVAELIFVVDDELENDAQFTMAPGLGHRAVLSTVTAIVSALTLAEAAVADNAGAGASMARLGAELEKLVTEGLVATSVDLARLMAIVAHDTDAVPPASWQAIIDLDLPSDIFSLTASTPVTSIFEHLQLAEGGVTDPELRAAGLLAEIGRYRGLDKALAVAEELLIEQLGLEKSLAKVLLPRLGTDGLVDAFVDSDATRDLELPTLEAWAAIGDDAELIRTLRESAPPITALYDMLRIAQRAALVLERVELDADTVSWLMGSLPAVPSVAAEFGLLELDAISSGAVVSYPSVRNFIAFARVGRRLGGEFLQWRSVLELAIGETVGDDVPPPVLDEIATRFSWPPDAVAAIATAHQLTWQRLREFEALGAIADAIDAVATTGVEVDELYDGLVEDADGLVTPERARAIKLQAVSSYASAQWAAIAGPVRDKLRVLQRDALRVYVLQYYEQVGQRREVGSSDDLHDDSTASVTSTHGLEWWMLHDNLVNPCRSTSRVREAVTALQTLDFQRNKYDPSDEWRRRYRTWEVQRKISMYAENWLEPSLRDDKTELFEAFESALSSAELNEGNLEKAVSGYLAGLDQVARLEVCGSVLVTTENGGVTDTQGVHVFARARSKSSKMWHRVLQRRAGGSRWTPWEVLPFEPDWHDVLPIPYNGRLIVAWPRLEIQSDALGTEDPEDRGNENQHYIIRLAWTEFQNGRWGDVREARGHLIGLSPFGRSVCESVRKIPTHKSKRIADEVRKCALADPSDWRRPADPTGIILDSEIVDERLHIGVRFVQRRRDYYDCGFFSFGACGSELRARAINLNSSATFSSPGPTYHLGQRFESTKPSGSQQVFSLNSWDNDILSTKRLPYQVVISHDASNEPTNFAVYQDSLKSFFAIEAEEFIDHSSLRSGDAVSLPVAIESNPIGHLSLDLQAQWALNAIDRPIPGLRVAKEVRLRAFQQPFVCLMRQQVERHGIEGLYHPAPDAASPEVLGLIRQTLSVPLIDDGTPETNDAPYEAGSVLAGPHPKDAFEFAYSSPYAQYNWELFYHIPMMVARRLMDDRRFEEARRWLHYIFDPRASKIGTDEVDYWRLGPLGGVPKSIETIIRDLAQSGDDADAYLQGVAFLAENPFQPFGIARLRPSCFMRATVMLYLDNLIAWGDELFARATIESVAQATQLYAVAQQLLGRRPERLPVEGVAGKSFHQLQASLGEVGNAMVDIENQLVSGYAANPTARGADLRTRFGKRLLVESAVASENMVVIENPRELSYGGPAEIAPDGRDDDGLVARSQQFTPELYTVPAIDPSGQALYFCVPSNDQLLAYWDRVDDRLYKVRHCLDLDGLPRTIRLFEPPIDPGALISALAGGVGNLRSTIDGLFAPPPTHRFNLHLQRAQGYVDSLIQLGSALQAAFESKDAVALASLQAGHRIANAEVERALLDARVELGEKEVEAVQAARAIFEERHAHYSQLLLTPRSTLEEQHHEALRDNALQSLIGSQIGAAAGAIAAIPDFHFGVSGAASPVARIKTGGFSVGGLLNAIASSIRGVSGYLSAKAQLAGIDASHARRSEDWRQQVELAALDLERIDAEKASAETRIELARRDIARHEEDLAQAEVIADYHSNKYSNEALYDWFVSEAKKVYYRCHNLALTECKRALASFARELEMPQDFIAFENWSGVNEGLRVGEQLRAQLRELSHAYYSSNVREFELAKQVSLADLFPAALLELQSTGRCTFDVSELHYDWDHPGHMMRRISRVGLTITSVRGAYTNLPAELTLLRSQVRVPAPEGSALRIDQNPRIARIATSGEAADDGLFKESSNDGRYLPFEHRGAISSWQLRLPECQRGFDYMSIGDAIVTIHYTARDGGEHRRGDVETNMTVDIEATAVAGVHASSWLSSHAAFWRGISVRKDFANAWRGRYDDGDDLILEVSAAALDLDQADLTSLKVFAALVYDESAAHGTANIQLSEGTTLKGSISTAAAQSKGAAGPVPKVWVGPDTPANAVAMTIDPSASTTAWKLELDAEAGLVDILLYIQYAPSEHE